MKYKILGIISLLGIICPVMAQYHTVGMKEVTLGYGYTPNSKIIDLQYSYYITKRSKLGVALDTELGHIMKSDFQSYSLNVIYVLNVYSLKMSKFNPNKYSFKGIGGVGLAVENIANIYKNSNMIGLRFNTSMGVEGTYNFRNYIVGMQFLEMYNFNSKLGETWVKCYPGLFLVTKYSF